MSGRSEQLARLRALNDAMRAAGPASTATSRWLITQGIQSLSVAAVAMAVGRVRNFDLFDEDNDPHGEHDFGSFTLGSEQIFWKIDYYDRTLGAGSPDPLDSDVTCRVLTVMLASEY